MPPPPQAVPLPRHTWEALGSNGIIASPVYGGKWRAQRAEGGVPPSVIDTDRRITYLHFTSAAKWRTINYYENPCKKRKTSSKKPTEEEKLISSSVGFCTEATMPVPLFYVSYSYTTML